MRRRAGDAAVYAVGVLVLAASPALARKAYAPGSLQLQGLRASFYSVGPSRSRRSTGSNPRVKARAQRRDAATAELTKQLGRQPTPEEYFENWRRIQASWKAAGRPR